MADIIHRIGFKSEQDAVYRAFSSIKGLSNWWTEEVEGDEQAGGKIAFTFRSATGDIKGNMIMEVSHGGAGNKTNRRFFRKLQQLQQPSAGKIFKVCRNR